MITDSQLNELVLGLMAEISDDEKSLDRKRIKLDLLLELRAVSKPDGSPSSMPTQLIAAPEPSANGHNGAYAGLSPTDGIRAYLRDHGGSARISDMLDILSGQVSSSSDNPRHVVRNCVRQLSKKQRGVRLNGEMVTLVEGP